MNMVDNKIDIKQFADILCDKYAQLESYKRPAKDDKYVYVCAYCLMLRIDTDFADGSDLLSVDGVSNYDNYKLVKTHSLPIAQLRELYHRMKDWCSGYFREEYEQCPECLGSGEVSWEYMGTYRTYEKSDECPVCEGKGKIPSKNTLWLSSRSRTSMFGHVFYTETLLKLYLVLERLGVSECEMEELDRFVMRIRVSEHITIIVLFPIMIQGLNVGFVMSEDEIIEK